MNRILYSTGFAADDEMRSVDSTKMQSQYRKYNQPSKIKIISKRIEHSYDLREYGPKEKERRLAGPRTERDKHIIII